VQMLLVLLLAPLLTGFVRKIKARLLRRQGASVFQPYRDLLRLLRKEVVLADNASWLFRVTPYITFAAIWVAAALVPTFATGLLFNWTADLIAIVALLGSARFFLALAGMDVGTSFGGIGSSREVMIAALAEPAMLLIVFCMALVAGSTQLSTVANLLASSYVGLRVSLGMALIALIMVALAENARIPVDNPATHLELTMVHEAMVLEYSGRHLAMIEFGAFLKLLLYISLIACVFLPWKIALFGTGPLAYAIGAGAYIVKLAVENAGFPHSTVPWCCTDAGLARHASPVRLKEFLMQMHSLSFDISHTLAGGLVLVSFMMLYQDRLYSLLNVYALHALVLALSVAWQAFIQDAPHLYVTAAIALVFKAIVIPVALHRIVKQLGIHRDIESAVGIGPTMLAGMGLVALSMVLMLRVTAEADPLAREDLAFALSVVLLGLLVMVTRRNAVSQVVGFMSLENGLVLAATGAKGMPLVVEISVAFSILIAFIVIGIFLFRIRERFDSVDVSALDDYRGERE
jgi:formate hydrogenlyase subunit 4/hydrogenase-4 membrane subunit HyfE